MKFQLLQQQQIHQVPTIATKIKSTSPNYYNNNKFVKSQLLQQI